MLKPLIINRDYLFVHSPGGECLRTFVRALNKEKFEPIIYASDRMPLVKFIAEQVKLVKEHRIIQYIAAAIRRILLPDLTFLPGYEWYSWGIGVKNTILKDIKKEVKFDYIHSVSFPCASHIVALKIKKKTGLPWIMQLYDPWADNPYRPFRTKFLKEIDWKQERECVENADIIIHDNESIAELWKKRYGEEVGRKIVVLPLTIPLPNIDVEANTHKNGEVLTISHIGNFMLNRTSQPFILAVSVFVSKHPEFRNKLRINYIGQVTELEKELIRVNNLSDMFNPIGRISAEDCVDYYKNSDIFLAIDGVNKDNLFFPSKILKYLYFRRPILGITPKGSVLDCELKQAGHISLHNSDLDGIVDYLERAIFNYESLIGFNQEYWHKFEPKNVVSLYEELVLRLLDKEI